MPTRKRQRNRLEITYDRACELLEIALRGGTRDEILDALEADGSFTAACERLRAAMRSHAFPTASGPLVLHPVVQSFDNRARRAGLHVLESWDYRAHRFADEILPVLMLDRCALGHVPPSRRRAALSVLLDHYFVSVLGLLAASAWDDGDPNENLDRITGLLHTLSAGGSDTRFVDDAETLLLVSISHYHPDESAYDSLLADVGELNAAHQLRLALAGASALGGHLRWGLRHMYQRDVGRMRDDNTVDYPWLVFSLVTLWRELLRRGEPVGDDPERERVAEAFVNALTADPWLVTGRPPTCLRSHHAEHAELRDSLLENRDALLRELETHRPDAARYSPLAFSCNFLCNTIVAMVATALANPGPHPSLNTLFARRTQAPVAGEGADVARHAERLAAYARSNASHSDAPALIVYDRRDAAHSFNVATTVLRERPAAALPV